jgi:three-Cys-motif partner protein
MGIISLGEAVIIHIGVKMHGKKFFQAQTEVTRLKTLIYEQYLGAYLVQNIAKFKKCYIMDLFCGPGKNGRKNGSPLILIDILKNLLKVKYLRDVCDIEVIFNDADRSIISKLKRRLSKTNISANIKIHLYSESFEVIFYKHSFDSDSYKFFFLDPFNYSCVNLANLKDIFSLRNTEIFLFVPIFHAYRFSRTDLTRGKIRDFILSYTTKGIHNYKDIFDFSGSVKKKLSKYLKTSYVREFILHSESRINALFLITKNINSMAAANEIFWNCTKNGQDICSANQEGKEDKLSSFFNLLKRKLRAGVKLDILKFATLKGFSLKYAKAFIAQLKSKNRANQCLN